MTKTTPISGYLFFSGFLTGEGGGPGGYNGFPDTDSEEQYMIKDVVYLKVIKKLFTAHDIEKCPNRDRMKSQLHAHSTHQP